MKKLYTFMTVMALVFVLAACGSNNNQEQGKENNNNGTSGKTALLDQIKEEGKLKIGTEGTYPPFTFHDKDTGELTGFDVEVAKEVAKRIGVKPVFMETQWDAMFAGLDSSRFDIIANQVGIRPDRQEKYDFSDPYSASAAVLVVTKDNKDVKSFEDIKGLKAAQSLTSNYGDIAKSYGAELVGVPGFNEAISLLTSNRADVTINDSLAVLDYMNKQKDAPIQIVAKRSDAASSGFMFRKGNTDLVDAVNKALQDMKDDGTYLKISQKWFGEDVSK